ncbi:unnamed protein product [Dicrocoelium dendriticum]|nr:unnamed protein product [Dicrocoelium dendriticum]
MPTDEFFQIPTVKDLQDLINEATRNIPNVSGKQRLINACAKELRAFQQLPSDLLEHALSCSNLPHLRALVDLARVYSDRLVGILSQFRSPFPGTCCSESNLHTSTDSAAFNIAVHPGNVLVDLVCTQQRIEDLDLHLPKSDDFCAITGNASDANTWAPSFWIKVVTRGAKRLNSAWHGDASQRSTCLFQQAKELVSAAAWYVRGQSLGRIQVIVHWLPSTKETIDDLDCDLVDSLTDLLGVPLQVGYAPFTLENQIGSPKEICPPDMSLKCHAFPPGLLQSFFAPYRFGRSTPEERSMVVKRFTLMLDRPLSEFSPNMTSVPSDSSLPLDSPLDAVLFETKAPFGDTDAVFGHLPRINLDVSALIGMVSELSQFLPEPRPTQSPITSDTIMQSLASVERANQLLNGPRFKSATLDWLIEAEAAKPVLLVLQRYIYGAVLVACRTAVLSFLNILATVAGPSEWDRGIRLLSRLLIVPDVDLSPDATALFRITSAKENRRKTQIVMATGNAYGCLTVTSNSAFLRSIHSAGLKYSALLLPARALTESASKR